MFTVVEEAKALVKDLKVRVRDVSGVEIVVCPPFISLATVHEVSRDSNIALGAQNLYWEDKGAFNTGEISTDAAVCWMFLRDYRTLRTADLFWRNRMQR